MNPEAAERICEKLSAQPQRVKANNDCKVITIPNSGHFTFMDQAGLFNTHMQDTLAYLEGATRLDERPAETTHHGPLLDENNEGTTPEVIGEAFWGS